LDDERQREAFWPLDLAALRKHCERRHRDAMIVHERLGQILAAREHEPARIAAGVRDAHQLEIARDVLVVDDLAVKLLEQREHHLRLPVFDLVADRLEFVVHAERTNVVAGGTQRADHVVFGLPLVDCLLAEPLGRIRGYEVRMDEHQDTKRFHSAIHRRRDGPNSACIVLAVNRTVNSITSFRSEPTARRLSSRHLAIMSSSRTSSVSWYSPVHLATIRLIVVLCRQMNLEAACERLCLGSAENSRSRSRS